MGGVDDEAALLWVARETGVLPALLSSADTPAEAATEAGVSDRAARILTRALTERGFFEQVDGVHEPANRSLGFLTRRDVRSIGTLPHRADLLGRYLDLPAGVATGGEAGDPDGHDRGSDREVGRTPPTRDPDHWTVHRLGAVAATDDATVRALVTAAVRERPDADRVVDVGGAPGVYAREFARRGFDPTLADRPPAIRYSRPLLAPEPVDVAAAEYDAEAVDLPAADLAFLPDVTHRLGPAGNRRLLANVADALAPGGAVVAVDHVRGRSPRAPLAALEALATTPAGDVYPADRYREWFRDAGFVECEVRDVPGTDRQAVVGHRPE